VKTYRGVPILQVGGGFTVTVERDKGSRRRYLNPRFDLYRHSPDGFAWGYDGSGPAQLALALLADVFGGAGAVRALQMHQLYKSAVIANLPIKKTWTLTEEEILVTVRQLEAERRR
jgi:hypothetical protein